MDAYTLRKIAPRILIGVIGINLSIYLCVAAIDITNIIGRGLADLITAPFDLKQVGLDTGSSTVVGIIGILVGLIAGAYAIIGIGAGLLGIGILFILTIMLVVLSIMVTLVIRQTLLVLLSVLSPVAIACFVLPGTEKYFRQWWDLFVKTLLVYPIIAALFAVSGVMATISFSSSATPETTNLAGAFNVITGLILVFIPLFMIPWAFKFSGGIMAAVSNVGANQLQQLSRARNQIAKTSRAKNWEAIKQGNRYQGGKSAINGNRGNARGRLNRRLQTASIISTGKAGVNPLQWRDRVNSSRGLTTMTEAMKGMQESEAGKAVLVNDDLIAASLHGDRSEQSARQYLAGLRADDGVTPKYSGREIEQELGTIRAAKRDIGDQNYEVAAAIAQAGTKTGYAGGAGEMMATINRVAGDDMVMARSMTFAARTQAANAQRFDLSEAGAGTYLNGLMELRQAGNSQAAQESVTRQVVDDIVENKGAGYLISGHSNSYHSLAEGVNRKVERSTQELNDAHASGDADRIAEAERTFVQDIAATEALIDSASSSSPAAAKVFADNVHDTTINLENMNDGARGFVAREGGAQSTVTGQMTTRQMMDHLGGRENYKQMRRTYQTQIENDLAGIQQAQQGQGGAPPGPPNTGGPAAGP